MTGPHLAREEQLLLCGDATSLLTYQAAVDAVSFHVGRGAFVHDSDVTSAAGRIAHELDALCHVLRVDLAAPPRDEVQQSSNRRKRKGGKGWRIEMDLPYWTGSVCIVVDCNEQSEDVCFTLVSADGIVGPATVARCQNHGGINCLDEGNVSLQVISRAARCPPTQYALLLCVSLFHSRHTHRPPAPFPLPPQL
jgi:hypothetical protein